MLPIVELIKNLINQDIDDDMSELPKLYKEYGERQHKTGFLLGLGVGIVISFVIISLTLLILIYG